MTDSGRISLVEDDPEMRHFLAAGLEAHGYQVAVSETGQQALTSLAGAKPDVILLDLGLPDVDGTTLIDEIRSWSQTPIIVVSSRTAVREKIQALDHGASD